MEKSAFFRRNVAAARIPGCSYLARSASPVRAGTQADTQVSPYLRVGYFFISCRPEQPSIRDTGHTLDRASAAAENRCVGRPGKSATTSGP
jgi:hypothetical protein